MSNILSTNWTKQHGPYGLWQAVEDALDDLRYESQRLVVVHPYTHSHQPLLQANCLSVDCDKMVEVAIGLATANPALRIIVIAPAEDLYSQAWASLQDAAKCNHNLTIIVGQMMNDALVINNQAKITLSSLKCWQARSLVSDPLYVSQLIALAIKHDGLALVEVIIPSCTSAQSSYQLVQSKLFYLQSLNPTNKSWSVNDSSKAWHLLDQAGERIDVGIIFAGQTPSYQKRLIKKTGGSLVDLPLKVNTKKLLDSLE